MITILGCTATGKTALATRLALQINGEVISADSRQVYRGMDIGTGKDLNEFEIDNKHIPYHLIDIVDAGYEYNVFEYQNDFIKAYNQVINNGNTPILCGGTGMYLESVLNGYKLINVPENYILRSSLSDSTDRELVEKLQELKKTHNTTDSIERDRIIRAIEIEEYYKNNPEKLEEKFPTIKSTIFGVQYSRDEIMDRIKARLVKRLEEGMIDEVISLVEKVGEKKIMFYGLEYKFITKHINGSLSYKDMFDKLNIAIRQFAKRQSTWFRKMEREGHEINWLDGNLHLDEKIKIIIDKSGL